MTAYFPVGIHRSQTGRMVEKTQSFKSDCFEHRHVPLKHFECLLCSRHCARCWVVKDEREMVPAITKFTVVQGQGRDDNKTNR